MHESIAKIRFGFNIGLLASIFITFMMNGLIWSVYDNPSALEPLNYVFYGAILSIIMIRFGKKQILSINRFIEIVHLIFLSIWATLLIIQSGVNSEPWMTGAGWFYLIYPCFTCLLVMDISINITFDYLRLKVIKVFDSSGEPRKIQENIPEENQNLFQSLINAIGVVGISFISMSLLMLVLITFNSFGFAVFLNLAVLIGLFQIIYRLLHSDLNLSHNIPINSKNSDGFIKGLSCFAVFYAIFYYIFVYFTQMGHYLSLSMLILPIVIIIISKLIIRDNIKSIRGIIKLIRETLYIWVLVTLSVLPVFTTPPLYFLPRFLIFSLFGFLIARFLHIVKLSKRNISHHKLLLIGVSIFSLHLLISFIDGILNGYNYHGPLYDDLWPFIYIGSIIHYFIVGTGLYFVIKGTYHSYINDNRENPPKKIEMSEILKIMSIILLSVFGFGLILFAPSYNLFTYGGGISNGIPEVGDLYYTITSIGYGLFAILYVLFLIKEVIMIKSEQHRAVSMISSPKIKNKPIKFSVRTLFSKSTRKDWFKIVALVAIILIPVFIYQGYIFRKTHTRPIIAYSPSKHVIWVEENTDRVSPQQPVVTDGIISSGSYELSMAKNEYEAFQIVIRPLNTYMNEISFDIDDMKHLTEENTTIPSENITIRYAEPVIKGQYNDILKPIESHPNLKRNTNHAYWVSIRTSNQTAGTYSGKIEVNANDLNKPVATLNLRINIWNFTIPEEWHTRTNIGRRRVEENWVNTY
ncbi:MAG: hypothetical protein GF364_21215, partial [Candidatus Lokiarchaeota archaeon]|nr:hypothetical protein [Candidatus Lokiarchaeota archaeon]